MSASASDKNFYYRFHLSNWSAQSCRRFTTQVGSSVTSPPALSALAKNFVTDSSQSIFFEEMERNLQSDTLTVVNVDQMVWCCDQPVICRVRQFLNQRQYAINCRSLRDCNYSRANRVYARLCKLVNARTSPEKTEEDKFVCEMVNLHVHLKQPLSPPSIIPEQEPIQSMGIAYAVFVLGTKERFTYIAIEKIKLYALREGYDESVSAFQTVLHSLVNTTNVDTRVARQAFDVDQLYVNIKMVFGDIPRYRRPFVDFDNSQDPTKVDRDAIRNLQRSIFDPSHFDIRKRYCIYPLDTICIVVHNNPRKRTAESVSPQPIQRKRRSSYPPCNR